MTDNLSIGLSITLIALGTVFFILFLLQIVMKLQEKFFTGMLGSDSDEKSNENLVTAVSLTNSTETVEENFPEVEDDTIPSEVIAAITAAIAMYTETSKKPYRLVSVRKRWDKEASFPWSFEGSQKLIKSRERL